MTLNRSLSIWPLRFLLAALLLFGSEVLLWLNLPDYDLLDWLIRIIAYLVLSTLLIDIAVRYRIRDVYDSMVLFAGYALLHSLLIKPELGWQRIPDTLLTHIIGAEALTALLLWGVFLVFLRGDVRKYHFLVIGGLFWLGFYWGTWMRWTPELRETFAAINLSQMFMYAGIIFAPVIVFYALSNISTKEHESKDYLLSPLEWAIAGIILLLLFLYQAILGKITMIMLIITAILITLCWAILWSRREELQISLMEKHFPMKPLNPVWLILFIAVFVGATILAYKLPLVPLGQFNQLWLMEIGFFGVGTLWLPLVSIVLAMRGMDRAMREGQRF